MVLRHPVTILVTDFTNPDNMTNDLLILNPLIINKSLDIFTCRNRITATTYNSRGKIPPNTQFRRDL